MDNITSLQIADAKVGTGAEATKGKSGAAFPFVASSLCRFVASPPQMTNVQ